MKTFSKYLAAVAGAAMIAAVPAPAEAQWRDHRDRDGIDAGDIITGVAILGGIAAIAGAFDRDRGRYGDRYGYRYRDDYTNAVNSCGYEAERRAGRGAVRVTDVDRVSRNRYRVRGTVEGYGGYGYDRYDRNDRYGRYDRYDRYGRYDRYDRNDRYDRYDRYDRNDRYGRYDRDRFTCYAYGNGRIQDFRIRG